MTQVRNQTQYQPTQSSQTQPSLSQPYQSNPSQFLPIPKPPSSTISDTSSRKTKTSRSSSIFGGKPKLPKSQNRQNLERRLSRQAMATFGVTEDDIRVWQLQAGRAHSIDRFSEQELEAIIRHYECLEQSTPVVRINEDEGNSEMAGDERG